MADEPTATIVRVSDAHDAMEGQPDPSCFSLSESGVSMRNGTTEMEVDVEEADRKKDEIGQKSAVFMILRRFATGKS